MPRVLAEPALEELAAGRPARSAPTGLARLAASVGNAAFARLARQAAPARERTNLVFIMGADAPDRPGRPANHFYTLAREYAARWHGTIVAEPRYRTLTGIFAYLREHPELRVGDLYLVTHANADGDLLFPLDERDADRRVTYPELAESLSAHGAVAAGRRRAPARRADLPLPRPLHADPGELLAPGRGLAAGGRLLPPRPPHPRSGHGGARPRPDRPRRRIPVVAGSPGRHAASGVLTEYRLRRDLPFRVADEEGEEQRFFTTSFSEPGHPVR